MTTPILYLDADDEITSAAARIRSTTEDRIALVLPYGSRLATSRINFRLLAREATERGKTIEIVAADSSARALAAAAGLPVHPSVAAFEAAVAGLPIPSTTAPDGAPDAATAVVPALPTAVAPLERYAPDDAPTSVIIVPRDAAEPVPVVGRARPPVRSGVAVGMALGLAALVGIGAILAFVVLPSATIVLAPRSQEIGPLVATVEARPDVSAPDPASLTIPSHSYTFPVEAHQTFPTTGIKVTDTPATGQVTFANFDTGGGNTVASGSIVKTSSGTAFRTLSAATMPAASVQFIFPNFVVVPSTSTVGIEAVVNGPDGNVAAKTIVVVPKGENKNLLKVTNQDSTSGGAHNESPEVSKADVDTAMAALQVALGTALDTKVQAAEGVPAGTTLFPETKTLGTVTPTVDPKSLVGTAGTTFDLGATAEGTVVGVDASPVRDLAAARLQSDVDAGSTLDPATIKIDVGTPTVTGEIVSFPVTMRATEIATVDQAALLASIRGLDVPAVRARLSPYGEVDIQLWPDWVTTIPTNPDRVKLTITEPRPAPSPTP
jgi:hypothetical protein